MPLKHSIRIATFIAACLAMLPAARAEDARSVFDSLFAAKIKSVSATADRADDVALAKELLALAKTSENQPALVALLCDAAHDLGARHADGYAAAAEAMTLLADTVEEKRPAARDKLITLLTRQSASGKPDEREAAGEALVDLLITLGDEKTEKKQYAEAIADYRRAVAVATQKKSASLEDAKAKLEFAQSRDRTLKTLARLQEKLLKDANDSATAEEIVKLYVVELDDPESAKAYLNRVKDEQMKRFVPLAGGPIDAVAEADAMKLGEWYLAAAQASIGNARPYRRAEVYLARFLALHTDRDLLVTKAEALHKDAREKAKALTRLARGTVLGEDEHRGYTGHVAKDNIYTIVVPDEFDVSRTALRVRGSGNQSPDTNGDVFVRFPGGTWVKAGAWTKASCTKAITNDNWHEFSLAGVAGISKTKRVEVKFQYTAGEQQFDIHVVRWVVR